MFLKLIITIVVAMSSKDSEDSDSEVPSLDTNTPPTDEPHATWSDYEPQSKHPSLVLKGMSGEVVVNGEGVKDGYIVYGEGSSEFITSDSFVELGENN